MLHRIGITLLQGVEHRKAGHLPRDNDDSPLPGRDMSTATIEQKRKELSDLQFFSDLPEGQLDAIAELFELREYEAGDKLWWQGDAADTFVFIGWGRVKVVKRRTDGNDLILGIFGWGDPVGQVAAFKGGDFPAAAVALVDTMTLEAGREEFLEALETNPTVSNALLRGMMERNIHLVRRLHDVTASPSEHRLALLMLRYYRLGGVETDDGEEGKRSAYIPLPIDRQELSDLLDTRIETAIRTIRQWEQNGWIRTEDEGFTILDLDKIEDLARER
jgi:CRP/FNR family transcriptional regulator